MLKTKSYSFDLTDITSIEIEKVNWLIDYPASVNIKSKEEWAKFHLVDKKMKSMLQSDIDEANRSIANSEA